MPSADRLIHYMDPRIQKATSVAAWLALFFSILALAAFASGTKTASPQPNELFVESEDLNEAQSELWDAWQGAQTDASDEEIRDSINAARENLRQAYQDASKDAEQFLRETDRELVELDTEVEKDRAKALERLEVVLERLQTQLEEERNRASDR